MSLFSQTELYMRPFTLGDLLNTARMQPQLQAVVYKTIKDVTPTGYLPIGKPVFLTADFQQPSISGIPNGSVSVFNVTAPTRTSTANIFAGVITTKFYEELDPNGEPAVPSDGATFEALTFGDIFMAATGAFDGLTDTCGVVIENTIAEGTAGYQYAVGTLVSNEGTYPTGVTVLDISKFLTVRDVCLAQTDATANDKISIVYVQVNR